MGQAHKDAAREARREPFRVALESAPDRLNGSQAAELCDLSPKMFKFHLQRGSIIAQGDGSFRKADVTDFLSRLELNNGYQPGDNSDDGQGYLSAEAIAEARASA
ncbi:MAG: hypothetical protein KOO62_09200 [candidate division Zixibacteria bacterium]|nr:hypothetical protein [candidate division Zixibacteria bacterium]